MLTYLLDNIVNTLPHNYINDIIEVIKNNHFRVNHLIII